MNNAAVSNAHKLTGNLGEDLDGISASKGCVLSGKRRRE